MRHLFEYHEFEELSDEAKKNAINNVREEKYKGKWTSEMDWVVDDDQLFEPPHSEMAALFGEDYYADNGDRFMIENTRKDIYLVGNYYLQCKEAMNVTNDGLFLRWLGIPNRYRKFVYYNFYDPGNTTSTTIDLEIDDEDSLVEKYGNEAPDELGKYFDLAKSKFDKHIDWVLTNISKLFDSQFEDEGVIETIESEGIKFDDEGNIEDEEE